MMKLFGKRTRVSYPMIFDAGLLGAKGNSPQEAHQNRLDEIERRILALEAGKK